MNCDFDIPVTPLSDAQLNMTSGGTDTESTELDPAVQAELDAAARLQDTQAIVRILQKNFPSAPVSVIQAILIANSTQWNLTHLQILAIVKEFIRNT